jgi:hypothetical protein
VRSAKEYMLMPKHKVPESTSQDWEEQWWSNDAKAIPMENDEAIKME